MDELVPRTPWTGEGEKETTVHLDPLLERRVETRPWELRAAQWRAWALAEAAFGVGVRLSLSRAGGPPDTFRGLLNLAVPFRDLRDHRERERLFLAWAHRDPVLERVPFVFVFEPVPVEAP